MVTFKIFVNYQLHVIKPSKIDHVSAKNHQIFVSLLYHNLLTITINATESSPLLQNLMGFLPQFTDTLLRTEDISENITQCNLHSHG